MYDIIIVFNRVVIIFRSFYSLYKLYLNEAKGKGKGQVQE